MYLDFFSIPFFLFFFSFFVLDDHARGLTTFTVLAGCGGFIGYLLGAVDWTKINIFGKMTLCTCCSKNEIAQNKTHELY